MKQALYDDYKQALDETKLTKPWWFNCRAKQVIKELYPDKSSEASDQRFSRFANCFEISLRRKTRCAQKYPQSLGYSIVKFHLKVLSTRRRGTYRMKDIANMDQTPLLFVMDDGKAYADKGSCEVWRATYGSGLDKRQCSVQLTIFADGKTRVKPLGIFQGKCLRIESKEQDAWDRRVQVLFQEKAWCDEPRMLYWISQQWNNCFMNPPTNGSSGKILIVDVHHPQQTDKVKCILKKKTDLINIPHGCTSRVQPLDVVFNKPFKKDII